MGKLGMGADLLKRRRFFDSLANVLHSTFSNKNSTLSWNVKVDCQKNSMIVLECYTEV